MAKLRKKNRIKSLHVGKKRAFFLNECYISSGNLVGCLDLYIPKETTLERAAFKAGWSELLWSVRTQPVLP